MILVIAYFTSLQIDKLCESLSPCSDDFILLIIANSVQCSLIMISEPLFSSPVWTCRKSYCTIPGLGSALAAALAMLVMALVCFSKMLKFYIKVFYMMGKALRGKLSCLQAVLFYCKIKTVVLALWQTKGDYFWYISTHFLMTKKENG